MVDAVFDYLIEVLGNVHIVVLILSLLPIAEARLSIPIAIKYSIHPALALFLGFLGSTAMAAILLAALLPFLRYLTKTKLFRKISSMLIKNAEKKAEKIKGTEIKKLIGLATFVALPVPITGVWTGSLIAGVLNLSYPKAFFTIAVGNLITSIIVTLASVFFAEYINQMVIIFASVALAAVIIMLIKMSIPNKVKSQ